ncbi:MAG: 50S ribosomal protein L24 [Alphaproteobacteria bacterium]|nr:50S ribosomal protein L24 [Alphaproteobacteria bacterium]
MASRIKKGDMVVVTTGRNKTSKGEVLKVLKSEDKALVKGINVVKRHVRPSAVNPEGGIVEKELPIHLSNLAHVDPETGRATRIRFEIGADGKKIRVAKRSGKRIDG